MNSLAPLDLPNLLLVHITPAVCKPFSWGWVDAFSFAFLTLPGALLAPRLALFEYDFTNREISALDRQLTDNIDWPLVCDTFRDLRDQQGISVETPLTLKIVVRPDLGNSRGTLAIREGLRELVKIGMAQVISAMP